ncbi:MAG: hypothetical protein ACLTD2_00865 [Ruminococcus sp.]
MSLLSKQPKRAFEETVLKTQKLELLSVYSGEKCSILANGDKVSNVDIVYTCHEVYRRA